MARHTPSGHFKASLLYHCPDLVQGGQLMGTAMLYPGLRTCP